jgi:hypothetical protein
MTVHDMVKDQLVKIGAQGLVNGDDEYPSPQIHPADLLIGDFVVNDQVFAADGAPRLVTCSGPPMCTYGLGLTYLQTANAALMALERRLAK